MKTGLWIGGILIVALATVGCTDREAEARRAKEEAEAKARAEAARKEAEALPKAFQSEPFFKLNPDKKAEVPPAADDKKTNP
jgi:hypothetical protein